MSETVTCPRRMGEWGPWEHKEGLDHWRVAPNGDRCCSFCGSLHPDDFAKLCEDAAKPESAVMIHHSDKQYKVYVERPSVRNASEGGIKYYKQHTPNDKGWIDRVSALMREALHQSHEKYRKRGERQMMSMEYVYRLREAERKGWKMPQENYPFGESAWVNYWRQCEEYERNPEAGRPVPPHRSA